MSLNVHRQQTQMRSLVLSALIMSQLSYGNRFRYQYLLSEKYLPEAGMHFRSKGHTHLKKTNLLQCSRKAKIKRRRQRA